MRARLGLGQGSGFRVLPETLRLLNPKPQRVGRGAGKWRECGGGGLEGVGRLLVQGVWGGTRL